MKVFTEDEKIKIWIDYMVTIVALNNDLLEFPLRGIRCRDEHLYRDGRCKNGCKCEVKGIDLSRGTNYPILGVNLQPIRTKHKIRSLEEFCNEKDDRVSEGLHGWYNRFKNRIFKNEKSDN